MIAAVAAAAALTPLHYARAINGFGVDVFHVLAASQRDKNVLVSPFSIGTCLAMAGEGADGETWTEMSRTLKLDGMAREDIREDAKFLNELLLAADEKTRVETATALWVDKAFTLEPKFVQNLQSGYGSEAASLDFKSPKAVPTINQWASEKTHGRITQIVNDLSQSLVVLASAVAFKGEWTHPFDPKKNVVRPFNSGATATFMSAEGTFGYVSDEKCQFLRLPYGNQRFAMEIALPTTGQDFDDFVKGVDAETWQDWREAVRSRPGSVSLPRWKGDYAAELSTVLQSLGMRRAFSLNSDFSRMIKDSSAFLGEVNHRTAIVVDEKGTEAAAATSSIFTLGIPSKPPAPFVFDANRPFVYTITESQTGTLLFLGVMRRPN
jgi:serpin B